MGNAPRLPNSVMSYAIPVMHLSRVIAALALADLQNPKSNYGSFSKRHLSATTGHSTVLPQGIFLGFNDNGIRALFFFCQREYGRVSCARSFPPLAPCPGICRIQQAGPGSSLPCCQGKSPAFRFLPLVLHGKAKRQDPPLLTPGEWEILFTWLIEGKRLKDWALAFLFSPAHTGSDRSSYPSQVGMEPQVMTAVSGRR